MTLLEEFFDRIDTPQLAKMRFGIEEERARHVGPRRYAHLESKIATIDRALVDRGVRYVVGDIHGHQVIACVRCHRTSANANDVAQKYCGYCHEFLEGA